MILPKLEYPTYEAKLHSLKTKVKFRPFLLKEHKVLMTVQNASEDEIARIVKELLTVCTFGKIDIDRLPHFDVIFLFLSIRAKSISEMVNVIVNCKCGNKIKSEFNLEELEIKTFDNHDNKIMLTDTCGIIMKYPNIDNAIKFIDFDIMKLDEFLIDCIETIFDGDKVLDVSEIDHNELIEFINTFDPSKIDKIEKFFATSPVVEQKIHVHCELCNSDIDAKIKGLHNFFI